MKRFVILGQLYLTGANIWSSLIAFYRIVYIKRQSLVQAIMGDRAFLGVLLLAGSILSVTSSCLLAFFDDQSVNRRWCKQITYVDIESFQLYQASQRWCRNGFILENELCRSIGILTI